MAGSRPAPGSTIGSRPAAGSRDGSRQAAGSRPAAAAVPRPPSTKLFQHQVVNMAWTESSVPENQPSSCWSSDSTEC